MYFPRPQIVPFIVDRNANEGQPWQGIDGVASYLGERPRSDRHLQVEPCYGGPMVFDHMSMLVFSPTEQRCSPFIALEATSNSLVDKEMAILQQAAAVALRLSLIPGIPGHSLRDVLSRAAEYLQHLEPAIHPHRSLRPIEQQNSHALPPHRAQGLHDAPATVDPLRTWGEIVEALWRASMSLDDGTHAWAVLTRRLVVWRALVGEEASQVGEWARKEVVLALRVAT